MIWIKWLVASLAILIIAMVALAVYGQTRWSTLTSKLVARLLQARVAAGPAHYDERELQGLPEPVQRYFRTALTNGMPIVAGATVTHAGTFNMGETSDSWKPFSSHQRVTTRRPGFVWNGSIQMLPGVPVRVHDAYVAGAGILHPAVLGLISLVNFSDTDQLARDELMRFLAEAAWYPTALLPSQGVRWEPVDSRSARARLEDGSLHVSLTFGFGDDGLIAWVRADARGRMVGGHTVPTPWEGRWSNYQLCNGMRVPMSGEVAWLLPGGDKPYWRGTITLLEYEFAR